MTTMNSSGKPLQLLIALIQAMRLPHWIKGIFVFFPLIFGERLFDIVAIIRTTDVFFLFGVASSAMYLINDVFDIDEDRTHPQKSKRPIAAGRITVSLALLASALLIAVVIPFAYHEGRGIGIIITLYLVLNYLYVRYLKHMVIVDVFCLGAFFYLRLIAGAIAGGIVLSNWMLICTVLLALFLGFNKRRYDIDFSRDTRPVLQRYDKYFLDRVISVISATLIMAYSLYVIDPRTIERFDTNHLIYTIPFLYYGVFRYMYVLETKWFGGDPVRILFADYKLQIAIVLWLAVSIAVIYCKI